MPAIAGKATAAAAACRQYSEPCMAILIIGSEPVVLAGNEPGSSGKLIMVEDFQPSLPDFHESRIITAVTIW